MYSGACASRRTAQMTSQFMCRLVQKRRRLSAPETMGCVDDDLWAYRASYGTAPNCTALASSCNNPQVQHHCQMACGVCVPLSCACPPAGGAGRPTCKGSLPQSFTAVIHNLTLCKMNITLLDLSQMSVRGPVPAELSTLTSLTGLVLSQTNVSGLIPPQLSTLTGLAGLVLSQTNVSRLVPSQLSTLTSLAYLSWTQTKVSGKIPPQLSTLTSLTYLDLSQTSVSGPIPVELSTLTSLKYLWLYQTDVSGLIPPQLSTLTGLAGLDLS